MKYEKIVVDEKSVIEALTNAGMIVEKEDKKGVAHIITEKGEEYFLNKYFSIFEGDKELQNG